MTKINNKLKCEINIVCLFTQMLNLIKFTLEGSLSSTHKNFGVYPLHLSVLNNDDRNLHA